MSSYVSNFKKFIKSEDSKLTKDITSLSEQDEASLLTDPDLIRIEGQIRDLEKQLELAKQQKEAKLKDLRSKIEAAKAAVKNQPAQLVQPTA